VARIKFLIWSFSFGFIIFFGLEIRTYIKYNIIRLEIWSKFKCFGGSEFKVWPYCRLICVLFGS
jgi:hypothetical protein